MADKFNLVAEEGNRRVGGMTKQEIEQCVMDIKSFFVRNGCTPNDGARASEVQKVEKTLDNELPQAMRCLLQEMDGGVYILDKEVVGTERMIELINDLDGNKLWKSGLIPLAGDESGLYVINKRGEVVEWDADDGVGDMVDNGDSLESFLENYRNLLLGGQCEFLKGVGVIEKVAARRK